MRPIIFNGTVWRAPTGYVHDRGTSVADVLRYEVYELHNKKGMYLDQDLWRRLEFVDAWICFWACPNYEDAERYGDPEPHELKDAVIIGGDGEGGLLLLKDARLILD